MRIYQNWVCPDSSDTRRADLGLGAEGFEVERAEVADRRVPAARVVEAFDVFEGGSVDGGWIGQSRPADALQFQGAPEGLHRGIVVAVGAAAHRGDQAVPREHIPKRLAGILDATIGVHDQARLRMPMINGHHQRPDVSVRRSASKG